MRNITMGNNNIYYMTPQQMKVELDRLAKYMDGDLYKAIIIDRGDMKFIIILN